MKEVINITVEKYNYLLERDKWLDYLEAAGVDNWAGYAVAKDLMYKDERKGE